MDPVKSGVFPCYKNQFQVGASKEEAKEIAECESFSVSIDNGVETWTSFTQEGWQSALQTAKAITISVSAKRVIGDAGNDFVAGKWLANGQDAYGYFAWTFPDGTVVSWDKAVISVTNNGGGDATNVAPLEFDIISNGKPKVTESTGSGTTTESDATTE